MDSVINKCMCCGNELGSDPYCKICGKSPLSVTGGAIDSMRINQMARMYIGEKLRGINIQVKCHNYDYNNGEVTEEGESYIDLCTADKYWVGDTVFAEASFEPLPSDREFTVEIRLIGNDKSKDISLTIKPSNILFHFRIGLCFTECLKARLIIGNRDNYCYSDEFSVNLND